MPIEYMFCFMCSEKCIKIISSCKKVWLVLYSRKLFLITQLLFFKKWFIVFLILNSWETDLQKSIDFLLNPFFLYFEMICM